MSENGLTQRILAGRPWWMNAMMAFCFFMALVYMPYDMFWKPVEQDSEIWFGIALKGWWAKATEPLHWAIYGAGAWGFWKMRPWMHPWAAVYVAQVAIAFFVFAARENGIWAGLIAGLPFAALTWLVWRNRPLFGSPTASG